MLSRFFEEHEVNENPEDDYFDFLIAAIQIEPSHEEALLDHQYLEILVMLPSSSQFRKKTAQDLDETIKLIKDLILNTRPGKAKNYRICKYKPKSIL